MWCKKCGEYLVLQDTCTCKAFNVVDEDGEDYEIFAISPRDAAEKFAKQSNENGDNYLLEDGCALITVNGLKFSISAEPDIQYFANQIK